MPRRPVNAPTLDFTRQDGIVAPSDLARYPVTVIGAGGIGSPTVLVLAKMGVQDLTVYDPDQVEAHNLPNQMFRVHDSGEYKVDALTRIVSDFSGVRITARRERFTSQPLPRDGIVIVAPDNMQARKDVWAVARRRGAHVPLLIEARMGAEIAQICTVRPYHPDDVSFYETTLYSDEEAESLPCTARAIIYNVFVIAGCIAAQMKKFVRGEEFRREIFVDLVTMTFA